MILSANAKARAILTKDGRGLRVCGKYVGINDRSSISTHNTLMRLREKISWPGFVTSKYIIALYNMNITEPDSYQCSTPKQIFRDFFFE